jgi:hypothetical protein
METTEKKDQASESGHWYAPDGSPAYTIIGKNGKERNTTIRDARKLGLAPSVTTIMQEANKPGLNRWLAEQYIHAALTLPRVEGETDKDLYARIIEDANEQAKKARERGTLIHAWVQSALEGEKIPDEAYEFYRAVLKVIPEGINFKVEQSFYYQDFNIYPYGGKVDLHCMDQEIVLDIKTTDKPLDDLKLWDEHYMQLSAYREGLGITSAKCGIIYVNSVNPEARLIWAEESILRKGLDMFQALKAYWYAKKW